MKSWKTTLSGCVGAVGAFLATIHDPSWVSTLGTIIVGLSTAMLGYVARDADVTSEQQGLK